MKHSICEILDAGDRALSVQVLQEFFVQATRETRPDRLSHEQAAALVESFARFPVQDLTTTAMFAAVAMCERFASPIGTPRSWKPPARSAVTSCSPRI